MTTTVAAPVLRRETEGDADAVARVFAAARANDLAGLPPALVELQLRAQAAQFAGAHPDAEHSVIDLDGVVVGRFIVAVSPGRLRLVDIAVLPEHQRRGLGSAVLADLCARADAASSDIDLTVWALNTGARRLYESVGFVAVDVTDTRVAMTRAAAS